MRSTAAAMQPSFLEKFVNGEAPLPPPHALRTAAQTNLQPRLPVDHALHAGESHTACSRVLTGMFCTADSSTLPDELARVLTHMRDLDETAVKLQGDIQVAVRAKVGAAAQKVQCTCEMVVHARCSSSSSIAGAAYCEPVLGVLKCERLGVAPSISIEVPTLDMQTLSPWRHNMFHCTAAVPNAGGLARTAAGGPEAFASAIPNCTSVDC